MKKLHKAILNGKIETVSSLINKRADVNALDSDGNPPIHVALCLSNYKTSQNILKLLIDAGADVNAENGKGITPLHQAVQLHNEINCQILIDAGADVDWKSCNGDTPLITAIKSKICLFQKC